MKTALCLIAAAAMFATGCAPLDLPNPEAVFADPAPPDYAPPPACPATPASPCPDDYCPAPSYQSFGQEIESATGRADAVDQSRADEVKGQCPTCPQASPPPRPTYTATGRGYRLVYVPGQPPIRLAPGERFLGFNTPATPTSSPRSPAMPTPEDPTPSSSAAPCPDGNCPLTQTPREGAFACQRCGRPTVGADWREVWADDGTPLTCLCNRCWESLAPAERASHLESYAKRTIGSLSPIVSDAIRWAAIDQSPPATEAAGGPPNTRQTWGTEF